MHCSTTVPGWSGSGGTARLLAASDVLTGLAGHDIRCALAGCVDARFIGCCVIGSTAALFGAVGLLTWACRRLRHSSRYSGWLPFSSTYGGPYKLCQHVHQ